MPAEKRYHDAGAWGLMIAAAVLDNFAITAIKYHLNLSEEIDLNSAPGIFHYCVGFFSNPLAAIALVILIFSPLLPFIAISRLELTIAYPVLVSLHLLLTMVVSYFVLEEDFDIFKISGVLLIVISMFFFYKADAKQR